MGRVACAALLIALTACGGDSKPLPPVNLGPEWMPLMMDTTENLLLRRMALWADTAHITFTPEGHAVLSERVQMDTKLGGISSVMRSRTEVDCAQHRYRDLGTDSLMASMNGVALPDSIARKALADQTAKATDTTWKSAGADSTPYARMIGVACGRVPAPSAKVAPPAAKLPANK